MTTETSRADRAACGLVVFAITCAVFFIVSVCAAAFQVIRSAPNQESYLKLAAITGSGPALVTALGGLVARAFKVEIRQFLSGKVNADNQSTPARRK